MHPAAAGASGAAPPPTSAAGARNRTCSSPGRPPQNSVMRAEGAVEIIFGRKVETAADPAARVPDAGLGRRRVPG